MNKSFSITFIITGEFANFHRKPMILAIAKKIYPNPVVIINRPFDFFPNFFRKIKKLADKKIHKKDNIYVYTPRVIFHDHITLRLIKKIKKINFKLLESEFNKLSNDLKIDNNIIWIMHPNLIDYISYIKHNNIIYDCYDEFIVKKALKNIEQREKSLVNKVNFVITSSKYLKEKKENLYNAKNIIFSSTAINREDFNKKKSISKYELKNLNGKIIGFAGSLRSDIDIDIIEYIAEKKNDCSIVLLGKLFHQEIYERLNLFNNIHFLGEKRFDNFITYLDLFDVSIMPHILNDFILSSSPYKFYQYIAASSYVVSTKIPELVDFEKTELGKKFLRTANNKEEFLEKIDYFLTLPKEKISEEELYSISWDQRFEKIKEKMIELKII